MSTKTAIKERPILFSGPMIRAILEGSKTQTRRVIKPQPESDINAVWFDEAWQWATTDSRRQCPYGEPGDQLWVREKWGITAAEHRCGFEIHQPLKGCYDILRRDVQLSYHYAATDKHPDMRWRPSIHMPRSASRLLLEVTDVRAERVQDIREPDAVAEGCEKVDDKTAAKFAVPGPLFRFSQLWDSINKKPGHSWRDNPWVWAVTFRRIEA